MLHLVTGRAGSGKTATLRNLLGSLAAEGKEKLLLIVPEQYSFLSERAILEQFGPQVGQRIEVLSFTRLAADYVFRELGGMAGQMADDASKIILMLRAMNSVQDKLSFYQDHANSVPLAKELLHLVKELHQAAVVPEQLETIAAELTDRTNLSTKLTDLSLILQAYEAFFSRNYMDEDLLPERLCEKLDQTNFFRGYTIGIDGFKGFTGQELELLRRLIKQADDVYITLPTPDLTGEDPQMIFPAVKRTGKELETLAKKDGTKVFLEGCAHNGIRFQEEALKVLEQELFSPLAKKWDGTQSSVFAYEADTLTEECNYIAATARKLMREQGLRSKDMAVIVRQEEDYKQELLSAFRRYDIPFFDDSRQPIINQPLIVLMNGLLTILNYGFTTENLLHYVKSGLSPLTQNEVSELENYALLWNLKAKDWQNEFTLSPFGLDPCNKDIAAEKLAKLNSYRTKIMVPLTHLKFDVKDSNAEGICKAFYLFLKNTNVPNALERLAVAYDKNGFTELAIEQDRIWTMLMDIFDKLATYSGTAVMSIGTFANLFGAVVEMATFANIPSGLDEITVGSADRIRLENPKVVFLAGCAEDRFPATVKITGVLNRAERHLLREEFELNLSLSEEDKAAEERFMAYAAACSATDRLYLSYHKLDGNESLTPSILITSAQTLFGETILHSGKDLSDAYFAETKDSAFATYARCLANPDAASLAAGLREALKDDVRLKALDATLEDREFQMDNPAVATELFGKDMGLSASRVDNYHKCAFGYFCRYGLKAEPRKTATLDAAHNGTVIHYVLEQIIKDSTMPALIQMTKEERHLLVERWLNTYVEEELGGLSNKPLRFQYLYRRLAYTLTDVVERLVEEFKNSDFLPTDFELSIGPKEGEDGIPAYTLPLPQGGSLSIYGSIDRVDTYEKDGTTYVRVVDYKSGGKDFVLSEVVNYGINMQMLIYLFATMENGGQRYKSPSPAGIYYYPAKRAKLKMETRAEGTETLTKQKSKADLGSGLFVLNEDLLEAMEHGLEKKSIPIGSDFFKKDGSLKDGLITEDNLFTLRDRINHILIQMASSLQEGLIPANPAWDASRGLGPCKYCDYYPICRLEEDRYKRSPNFKEVVKTSQQDAIDELLKKEAEPNA